MLALPQHARKLSLLALVAVFAAAAHAVSLSATGTYNYTEPSAGVYDYTITITNTGTSDIGTFWFAWVPGTGFLSAVPTDITSPTDWTDTVKPATAGKAGIEWTATTGDLDPGQSLTGFSFESTETPAELLLDFTGTTGTGDPVTTSTIALSGTPAAGSDYSFVVEPAPEPSTMLLTLTGLGLVAASFKSRLLRRA
jgi:hypothetical protein